METPSFLRSETSLEKSEAEQKYEQSAKFGNQYKSFIHELVGWEGEYPREEIGPFAKAAREHFASFAKKLEGEKPTASFLLSQLLLEGSTMSPEFEDPARVELVEPSSGVFIVRMDDELFRKIKSDAQAVAARIAHHNQISFVIVPRSGDVHEKENIPHEVHHIAWEGVQDAGFLVNNEKGDFLKKAFAMYQDELLARMVSKGSLFGYTHLKLLSPEEREKEKELNQEESELLTETVWSLNEYLKEVSRAIGDRGLDVSVLAGTTAEATSFAELERGIRTCMEYVETLPITRKKIENVTGWEAV